MIRQGIVAVVTALGIVAGGLVAGPAAAHGGLIVGEASWYGPGFHGRTTANGERYDMNGLTAAHKSLPFGTKLRVTNERTGASVVVRVNDRGPYIDGRVLDLSKGAAQKVGLTKSGVAPVRAEVIG